nr:PREDICTED: zinc finger protein 2 homolog isoform X1 [Bemisia tabaci]
MYCIAQDTGAPYVLYNKDSVEKGMPTSTQSNGQWGPGLPQENGYVAITTQQQQQQQHQQQQHQQQSHQNASSSLTGSSDQSNGNRSLDSARKVESSANIVPSSNAEQQQQSTMTSPEPSPYPQQTSLGSNEEDASTQTHDNLPDDSETQHQQQQYDMYSARGSTILSPGSFISYLKQPGIMLTPINPSEAGGDFSNLPDLLNHSSSLGSKQPNKISNDVRLFKCATCGKDFKQKSTLFQHERIHTDARPYGCNECGKRFRQQSHLTQHLRIHANEKPFACVYCERTFRQRAILNQHLRIHSGEKPFGCIECGKRFRQKAILNQHIRTHQGFVGAAVSKKRFKDDVSPHLIHKNGQLWPQDIPFPHEKENDGALENGNQCFSPESNVQFPAYYKDAKGMIHGIFGHAGKTFSEIIQHGRNIGMLLYVRCPICQKEFKQKSTLLQHGCIHIESRPYPCAECGKRFRQQSHLTQHLRIHTNEKPFTCIYCGRAFRQRTILNQHLRIHTGEKPYKCIECGKDFRQKAILDQHIRTHSGERPFCCAMPNCRRRFSTETEVKRHIDNHMNLNSNRKKIDKYCSNKSLSMSEMNSVPPVIKPEFYFPHYSAPPVFNPEQAQYSTPPSQQTPVPASDPSPSPGLSPASRPGSDPGISAPGPRGSGPGPGSPITESAPVQTIPNS